MERKLEIAKFHANELERLLPADPDNQDLPPISVQAHFEAAGRAVVSIPDQPRDVVGYVHAAIEFGEGIVQQAGRIEALAEALAERFRE